jgi:Tetracyclin repressor-like, C-terminal domain
LAPLQHPLGDSRNSGFSLEESPKLLGPGLVRSGYLLILGHQARLRERAVPAVVGYLTPSHRPLRLQGTPQTHVPRPAGAGADRGQMRPAAATQLVAEVGPALVMQRFLAEGAPVPDDYVVSVVDDVVMPLLRPETRGART